MKKRTRITTKKMIGLSVLFFLYISLSFGQTDNYGSKLLKMDQFKTAKNYFLTMISKNANDVNANYYLGEIYYRDGKNDSTEYYFRKGIVVSPNDYMCNIGLAKISMDKAKLSEAKSIFDKVNATAKYKDVDVLIAFADACISSKNKNFELATEYLQKAKELEKTKPQIYIVFGDMMMFQNNIGEAANEYERAFFYDKNCAEANYKLGKIYLTARNYDASEKAFLSAINIDSAYIPAWRDLAELNYSYGYYAKASESFTHYIKLTEPDLNDHVKYATLLFFNKEYQQSLDESNNVLKIEPKNMIMRRLKAYSLFETKDYTSGYTAITEFFKIAVEAKIIAEDYEYYGKLLSKNNQDSMAILNFQRAISIDSNKTALFENIGLSFDKLKKYENAVQAYDKLINSQKKPLSSDYFLLGKSCYFAGGSLSNFSDSTLKLSYFQKADTSFGKVIELSSSSYIGYFWRARVNSLLDPETDKGLAKPWYEKVISILELTPEKNKKELLEAYQYLGYYYYLIKENETSKSFWNKILAIDPTDKKALEALKGMK